MSKSGNVGGTIFYIDPDVRGTYTFYDSNGTQVSAPTVGTDCTGWTYTATDADPTRDKFYVYGGGSTSGDLWTPIIISGTPEDPVIEYVYEITGANGTSVGTGKSNTELIMNIRNGEYIQDTDTEYFHMATIWYEVQNFRNNLFNGCSDWYVPSYSELIFLVNSGVAPSYIITNFWLWSSTEFSEVDAWSHDPEESDMIHEDKNATNACAFIRSF